MPGLYTQYKLYCNMKVIPQFRDYIIPGLFTQYKISTKKKDTDANMHLVKKKKRAIGKSNYCFKTIWTWSILPASCTFPWWFQIPVLSHGDASFLYSSMVMPASCTAPWWCQLPVLLHGDASFLYCSMVMPGYCTVPWWCQLPVLLHGDASFVYQAIYINRYAYQSCWNVFLRGKFWKRPATYWSASISRSSHL